METSEKNVSEKKKSGGGKLSRSETVTVRLDPQLRYLIELAARKQRRTVSSFIEWALEQSLDRVELYHGTGYNGDTSTTLADVASNLWDVDDADRFAKLAFSYPDMLNHHEQILWKLICESSFFWRGDYNTNGQWTWKTEPRHLINERLRERWEELNCVARGELDKSVIPKIANKLATSSRAKNVPDLDDEIPF